MVPTPLLEGSPHGLDSLRSHVVYELGGLPVADCLYIPTAVQRADPDTELTAFRSQSQSVKRIGVFVRLYS